MKYVKVYYAGAMIYVLGVSRDKPTVCEAGINNAHNSSVSIEIKFSAN